MGRQVVRYEVEGRIATVTLDRPERLNAWTGRMGQQYRAALAAASEDPVVRVVIVTGAGRGFCAGADSEALAGHVARGGYDSGLGESPATPGYGVRPEYDADLAYHFGISKPIIAAVNGPAAGLGFALACYCDLRFAAAGAKWTTAHGRLGLPAELGLSWLLPRLVGATHAADLLLSSRVVLSEEAASMGLVNGVLPLDELASHVRRYASDLAETVSPASIAASKAQLYADLVDRVRPNPAAAVEDAEARMNAMIRQPDFAEGVAALRERRPPRF